MRHRLLSSVIGEQGQHTCARAVTQNHSFAVTQSGAVFRWGLAFQLVWQVDLRPVIVEGFGGVRVRRVSAGELKAFAIGEDGEVFWWGHSHRGFLGHGDEQTQYSPKRVEALRGVRVNIVSVGDAHRLALTGDGLVYAWGEDEEGTTLGDPSVVSQLLPKPVEALRGVRVGSVAAGHYRSYAVADPGELWAWGAEDYTWGDDACPLGHGEEMDCPVPKPIASLQGVEVDAVTAGGSYTMAHADNGSVYAWGDSPTAESGALGLGSSVNDAGKSVFAPQRVPGLRVACGLR
jgi:alpha-tubulin suppressor-like RCC1 family protein